MVSAAKLGTRVVVGAMLVAAAGITTASAATTASGAPHVATISGSGTLGLAGDNGPATKATLSSPAGVAADATGDVFIADTGNCRVREVPAEGGVTFGITMASHDIYTIAGTTCGSSGSGGPATRARLSFPSDVAVDAAGDVFIADTGNNQIRMISAKTGDITLLAGDGTAGFAGDAGKASASELDGPAGVAVDSAGDVFVADTNNCRVREIAARNGSTFGRTMIPGDIYTVAGNGTCGDTGDGHAAASAELFTPGDVAVDAHGDVLVADTGNRLVREVAAVAGTNLGVAMTPADIYTVAGSGTYNPYFGDGLPAASDASALSFPTGIALDKAGNLYIADTYGRGVRVVPAATGTSFGIATQADGVYTLAGAGPAETPTAGGSTNESVVYPSRLALDASGDLFVADIGNNTVEMIPAPPG